MKNQKVIEDCSVPANLKPTAFTLLGLLTAVGVGLVPINLIAAGPPYDLRVVGYLGDPAPGGGAFVNDFEPTALNDRGQLAFTAEPATPGKEAVFVGAQDTSGDSPVACSNRSRRPRAW